MLICAVAVPPSKGIEKKNSSCSGGALRIIYKICIKKKKEKR